MTMWRNWVGEESCAPAELARPASVEEVVRAVRRASAAGRRVRVVGSGHSFGDQACTDGTLISLERISGLLEVDRAASRVRVAAGTPLWRLNELLAEQGLALPNLGDIDRQSIAGAISTATHGTGRTLGNFATWVVAVEIVLADGRVVTLTEDDAEQLAAARVSLGALGAIVTYTLRVVPAFRLHYQRGRIPLTEVLANLDELVDGNDRFEFFVFPNADVAWTKTINRTEEPGAARGRAARWFDEILIENRLLDVLCRVGKARPSVIPRLNRGITRLSSSAVRVDASHRILPSVRAVRFNETEWAVPREAAATVLREAHAMVQRRGFAVNFPFELRFVAADEASFLSNSWGRETAYLAAHLYAGMDWRPFFAAVQEIAVAHGGRPHWGKRHTLGPAELAELYPAWDRFQAVRAELDPEGLFTNDHVRRVLGDV